MDLMDLKDLQDLKEKLYVMILTQEAYQNYGTVT